MENKTLRLIIILSIVAVIGICYMINDIYVKPYWDNRCEKEAMSAAQNASLMTTQWIIQDLCNDGRIDVNENGTIKKVSLNELCSR